MYNYRYIGVYQEKSEHIVLYALRADVEYQENFMKLVDLVAGPFYMEYTSTAMDELRETYRAFNLSLIRMAKHSHRNA